MSDLINIRILQHDTQDQIRIGMAYPVFDLDKAEQGIIKAYEKDTAWCGGFNIACEKYYKRIAIVSADTLEVIRSIYDSRDFVFIVENSKGENIGTITIQADNLPSHITICKTIREKFPQAATYKLQSKYKIQHDSCPVEDLKKYGYE